MEKKLDLEFVTSAALYEQCLDHQKKEIAFVGASNAGKSSAINALSNNKKLAKISKTPGKTKLFNFFKCNQGYIVDFPGYGFSKVSKQQKKEWSQEIPKYFQYRNNLIGVLIFTDIRHPMKESDVDMISMLINFRLPFKIVLTKSDKVSRAEKTEAEQRNIKTLRLLSLEKLFHDENISSYEEREIFADVMSFSIKDQESVNNLRKEISALLSN
mgnify:CR=1 FL=1